MSIRRTPVRQSDILHNPCVVADTVAEAVTHGKSAKDVVMLTVSAPESVPAFNAGHGACLNRNGIHQVSVAAGNRECD